ncbi:MAG: septation regulator SpoVG [Clostridiales bacterium]|nr:septation regulator SpoVG [Clostridiales bacterium]
MDITEVRLRLVKEPGKLKAAASITIDDCFVVHDLRVVETEGGLFVAMPNKRMGTGEFRDVAHPINNSTRDYIAKLVIDKYKEELERASAPQE